MAASLNNDSDRNAMCFLFGNSGTSDGSYSAADAVSDVIKRMRYRHHTVQRILKEGEGGNPAVLIQMCLKDIDEEENWVTIATLNNTTTYLMLSDAVIPYLRAKRSDGSTDKVKVIVMSGNDRSEV